MRPHFHSLSAALAVLAMCSTGMASATPMTYFGADWKASGKIPTDSASLAERNTFQAALQPGYQNEGFSNLGLDPFTQDPWKVTQWGGKPQALWGGGSLTPSDFSDVNAQLTASRLDKDRVDQGRFDTTGPDADGNKSWWFESDQTFTVSFGGAFSAFGFYITDAADWGGTFSMVLTGEDGSSTSLDVLDGSNIPGGGANNGGLAFFGFSDQAKKYTSAQFVLVQRTGYDVANPDVFGFDDLVVGNVAPLVVPEPASIALVALALAGAAGIRRKTSV